jgi:mono/diheme cytochrome c family protein
MENFMLRNTPTIAFLLLFASLASAAEPALPDATRGELLYANHCIACHTIDVHWRDKKLVSDLASLRGQVDRWQKMSALGWDDDDVAQVTRYLDARHYHYLAPR